MTDENSENVTFTSRTGTGPWSAVQKEFFGTYVAFTVSISELNNFRLNVIRKINEFNVEG